MRKLFIRWLASLKHLTTSVFRDEVCAVIMRALPCILFSVLAVVSGALVSFLHIPVISFFFHWFFLLPPPLVAMTASPLYVPFLVRSLYKKHKYKAAHWLYSIRWALMMYTAVLVVYGAVDWVVLYGSTELLTGLVVCVALLAISMSMRLIAFPIASVAVLFAPMKKKTAREVWRHAQRMMLHELPSIMVLWTLTMPIAITGYAIVIYALSNALVTVYGAHCIVHALNIVCWQVGWIAFMVFYQQRKKLYID